MPVEPAQITAVGADSGRGPQSSLPYVDRSHFVRFASFIRRTRPAHAPPQRLPASCSEVYAVRTAVGSLRRAEESWTVCRLCLTEKLRRRLTTVAKFNAYKSLLQKLVASVSTDVRGVPKKRNPGSSKLVLCQKICVLTKGAFYRFWWSINQYIRQLIND